MKRCKLSDTCSSGWAIVGIKGIAVFLHHLTVFISRQLATLFHKMDKEAWLLLCFTTWRPVCQSYVKESAMKGTSRARYISGEGCNSIYRSLAPTNVIVWFKFTAPRIGSLLDYTVFWHTSSFGASLSASIRNHFNSQSHRMFWTTSYFVSSTRWTILHRNLNFVETLSKLLALYLGNPQITVGFFTHGANNSKPCCLFIASLNKPLSKQSICRWFEIH